MAQYSKQTNAFLASGTSVFEVGMQADENGVLWNTRYGKDAWGRPKSITDYSLFSATWTFGIPARVWEEITLDLSTPGSPVITRQPTFSNVSSRKGMLSVTGSSSANVGTVLRSKLYPRYQPNRGHLYSTAVTCPNPTLSGYRTWGIGTAYNDVSFKLTGDGSNWDLRVVRERDDVVEDDVSITSLLPEGFDPSKGHVYDIQYQWRGAGSFMFFVDLKLVYTIQLLGTQDYLTVTDPALPVSYVCMPAEDSSTMELLSGCVDVTSEGGQAQKTLFGSIDTGDTLLTCGNSTTDTAVLALYVPRDITYNGNTVLYSRGVIVDKLVTWTRDESLTKVFSLNTVSSNNVAAIAANTNPLIGWAQVPDSNMFYMRGGTSTALNTAFQADKTAGVASKVVQEWADLDVKNVITNDSRNSDFQVAPGDILVITVRAITTNVKTSATLYYSEEL